MFRLGLAKSRDRAAKSRRRGAQEYSCPSSSQRQPIGLQAWKGTVRIRAAISASGKTKIEKHAAIARLMGELVCAGNGISVPELNHASDR